MIEIPQQFSETALPELVAALDTTPPVSIRRNPAKTQHEPTVQSVSENSDSERSPAKTQHEPTVQSVSENSDSERSPAKTQHEPTVQSVSENSDSERSPAKTQHEPAVQSVSENSDSERSLAKTQHESDFNLSDINSGSGATLPGIEQVSWCTEGYYLAERPIFTVDPLFHAGTYYVQEASSMFLGWIIERLNIEAPRILDLCAAPGGKTTQLAQYAEIVVSNEVIRSRAKILSENVQKWGSGNIAVTNNDPKQFGRQAESFFDIVVIDTPCSGEGMFRKNHQARTEWSPENVELCASRSRRIVSDAWNALRDGGVLIYSTCTFNRHENEDNANWICAELGGEILKFDDVPEGIVESDAGYRFFPHLVRGEGFYIVAIQKQGQSKRTEYPAKKSPKNMLTLSPADRQELTSWIDKPLNFATAGENVYGFTDAMYGIVEFLRAKFNLLYSGVMMGELIRGKLKPSHALAMYYDIKFDNRVELPLETAVDYLRKNPIPPQYFTHEGLTLITYENHPLGWLKKIGNRTNNLYPQNLRILHH